MMRATRQGGRLLPLLMLLGCALVALPGCDAGSDGGTPTGPEDQYNPAIDNPRPGLTAVATGDAAPGGSFGILGGFRDSDGAPLVGVSVSCYADGGTYYFDSEGKVVPYFYFATNPTLTDNLGLFSIKIYVDPFTPQGSYSFVVQTHLASGGPLARVVVDMHVRGIGFEVITAPTLQTATTTGEVPLTTTFIISVESQSSLGHAVDYNIDFGDGTGETYMGAGVTSISHTFTAEGNYLVRARGWDAHTLSPWSTALTVTVTAAAP